MTDDNRMECNNKKLLMGASEEVDWMAFNNVWSANKPKLNGDKKQVKSKANRMAAISWQALPDLDSSQFACETAWLVVQFHPRCCVTVSQCTNITSAAIKSSIEINNIFEPISLPSRFSFASISC